jgi:hypothetical protein
MKAVIFSVCAAVAMASTALAAEPVTVENYKRAETEFYMARRVAATGLGTLTHARSPKAVDLQDVIRLNRDTPYSEGVFDLTTPLTIVKPDGGKRFQSIVVINQDHYIKKVMNAPGTYTLTQEDMGSRYVYIFVRTFMDPNDPKDMEAGRALQDRVVVQQASPGKLELTGFDEEQRLKLHKVLLDLLPFLPRTDKMFGDANTVDPVQHLVGTSAGWAGNRPEDAIYISGMVEKNDGTTPHVIKVRDVPVDAFWSVTVYNAKGFYEKPESAISVNSVTAKPDADGGYTIRFGGDPNAANHLRIMPGWNYIVRLYRPRAEVISGAWKFPSAVTTN